MIGGTVSSVFSVYVSRLKIAHRLSLWATPVAAETLTWGEDAVQSGTQDLVRQ